MPIYEYECGDCGRLTEAWQKFSDPPLCECEACGGRVKKIISHNSFHLKGSGWYVTDYAGKSGGGDKAAGKPDNSSKSDKSDKSGTTGATCKGGNEPAAAGTAKKSAE